MDFLLLHLLVLSSPNKPIKKVAPKVFENAEYIPTTQRREMFEQFLLDEEWAESIDLRLSLILDRWEKYISADKESMDEYFVLKVMFNDYYEDLVEAIFNQTYFLHQTLYLKRHGFSDTVARNAGYSPTSKVEEYVYEGEHSGI